LTLDSDGELGSAKLNKVTVASNGVAGSTASQLASYTISSSNILAGDIPDTLTGPFSGSDMTVQESDIGSGSSGNPHKSHESGVIMILSSICIVAVSFLSSSLPFLFSNFPW